MYKKISEIVVASKLERAQILIEDGKPLVLYCASTKGEPHTSETFNVHIPLKTINCQH